MGFLTNNVKIQRTSDPSGYQFIINPRIDHDPIHLEVTHPLDSGLTASYDKKFKLNWTLTWEGNTFFRGDMLEELRQIFNSLEGLCFYPAPESHPTSVYLVRWANGFDFHPVEGNVYMGYRGKIFLEGTEVLSSLPSTLVMANTI